MQPALRFPHIHICRVYRAYRVCRERKKKKTNISRRCQMDGGNGTTRYCNGRSMRTFRKPVLSSAHAKIIARTRASEWKQTRNKQTHSHRTTTEWRAENETAHTKSSTFSIKVFDYTRLHSCIGLMALHTGIPLANHPPALVLAPLNHKMLTTC